MRYNNVCTHEFTPESEERDSVKEEEISWSAKTSPDEVIAQQLQQAFSAKETGTYSVVYTACDAVFVMLS